MLWVDPGLTPLGKSPKNLPRPGRDDGRRRQRIAGTSCPRPVLARAHFWVYRSGNWKRRAFWDKNRIFIGKFADMANADGNGGLFECGLRIAEWQNGESGGKDGRVTEP